MTKKSRKLASPKNKRAPSENPSLTHAAAPPEALFGYRLWQVHYAWHRHIENHLRALKLTHLQYVLLAATSHLLNDHQNPTQIRLANFTRIEKMMVSKNLRALERRGYIARKPHPKNRRANEIGLTPRGWLVLRRAFAAAAKAHATFFGVFSNDWQKFDKMLRLLMPRDAREL
jgi:DNA-binding MarR family transcriptional regulator